MLNDFFSRCLDFLLNIDLFWGKSIVRFVSDIALLLFFQESEFLSK